jgi:hypothetical protein
VFDAVTYFEISTPSAVLPLHYPSAF